MTANSQVVSRDTLTLLRDQTKRASVLSLFGFSLLQVIHGPTESTHRSMSWISVQKSDGVDDWWRRVSAGNVWWLHRLWEMISDSCWVYRVKGIGPEAEPRGTPKWSLFCEETQPLTLTDWNLSDKIIRRKTVLSLARYARHVVQTSKKDAVVLRIVSFCIGDSQGITPFSLVVVIYWWTSLKAGSVV